MRVLVVNAGSSSLKLRVLDGDRLEDARDAEGSELPADLARWAASQAPDAVGHRVVHGGPGVAGPERIDQAVMARLRALVDLAPLHQPPALAAVEALAAALPALPAVACYDTAFHARLPAAAATYALPAEWRTRWGLRRYGFHGLSHNYASARAAELLARPPAGLRIVSCHLGAGASLAAVAGGVSVDTTMGFTPLEGLVMATRAGSVDPGLVLWLQTHGGLTAAEVTDGLEHGSGLLGLTGTADMREIASRAAGGDPQADEALAVYCHRLRGSIAAMAAALGGLDALVFTGGVGERAPQVRERALAGLAFLGLAVDPARNRQDGEDREIGPAAGPVRVLVVAAREDLVIAREVAGVLDPQPGPGARAFTASPEPGPP